ncbi:MAG: hypothetical protein E7472_05885 [Ruminococcaceae bacterium]|nr:hypothetical protein [Oscillospiraceae bacterium]
MDENTPAPAGNEQPKKQRSSVLRHIMAVLLTLVLIFLAMLVFLFRDELTGEGLRRNFGREQPIAEEYEAFTYETGAEQVFAPVGDGLAVATSSSVQLLDGAGETVFKQVVSYELPAVFGGTESALFCDLRGTGCMLVRLDGESVSITPPGEIITASLTESGWPVLVTNEAGYKSRVSVYNSACELQYEWWSGSGYVLRAALGPDNRTLAVLTVEKDCGMLRFFSLGSENVQAELSFPETLYYDLYFMSGDTVCLAGEEGLLFASSAGELCGEFSVGDSYLVDYSFGSRNYVVAFVSSYRSGAGGTLVTLDQRGQELGRRELDRDIISLSAGSKHLLVMTGGGLYLYGQDLMQQSAKETLITAKKAILRPDGDVLLLSAYSAERIKI